MKNTTLTFATLHALGTICYVIGVVAFLFYAPKIFGEEREDTVLIPIAMLLLFIVSASVTGLLVLGRPVMWYLDGKKKEAVSLLVATVGFLALITFLAFSTLALTDF